MFILLVFAFIAGIVTILSPCILPILPIVLSGAVGGSRKRPLGIIIGFLLSFTFFTLFLTTLVKLTGIPSNTLRIAAAVVLLVFGASLLIPKFQSVMEKLFSKLSVFAPKANPNAGLPAGRQGLWGGFVIGLSIGLIWTPCVGPIMASVIALAATSTVNTVTFLVTLTYAIGSAIPMFIIMVGGRKLLNKAPSLVKNTEKIQKGFGVLMIVLALAIFANLDQQFENYIASTPYGANLTSLEQNDLVTQQLNQLKGKGAQSSATSSDLLNTNTPASDFTGITKWLNLPAGRQVPNDKPLTLKDLRGKVVLVDFWTYTCINCIRTLSHVTSWYDKYHKQGFVVVGVHTPEFPFEKETPNVEQAIKQYNIHYPVAQDNDYNTWNAYSNEYWPAEYLIDAKGNIRRTHFGEGEYDQMELAIQTLLKDAGHNVTQKLDTMPDQTPGVDISPETYLGANRMQYYYPSSQVDPGKHTFSLANNIPENQFSLGGEWTINDEEAVSGKNATLEYNFTAEKVHLVLRPGKAKQPVKLRVLLDNKPVDTNVAGADVKDGVVTIDEDRLYTLIDLKGKTENHSLKLEFISPGTEA